ncbi:unnamed protein product [Protopolystoma xenopodis]|uniref:C2H2-type domain-containing protein n=1 Tax=Protopolystoma xenopodis TaxID=117903 RepID=A0A3S5CNN7_9PLAT|nr:unnamed protein product [Protopolystoma xenopodis]
MRGLPATSPPPLPLPVQSPHLEAQLYHHHHQHSQQSQQQEVKQQHLQPHQLLLQHQPQSVHQQAFAPSIAVSSGPVGQETFACDQCKKIFSKHSSLARHKYEHTGESNV